VLCPLAFNGQWDTRQDRARDVGVPEIVFVKVFNPRQSTGCVERSFYFFEASEYKPRLMVAILLN
jgi:hypothetical protein